MNDMIYREEIEKITCLVMNITKMDRNLLKMSLK